MPRLRTILFVAICLSAAELALAQTDMPMKEYHRPDPVAHHQEMCSDHQAKQAARMAYVESKLELTDSQKPLFAKWRQTVLESGAKEKASCLSVTPKPDAPVSIVDREAHLATMLTVKLQSLQATQATLKSFYDSLTPAQKQILDKPHHGGGHWGGPPHRYE